MQTTLVIILSLILMAGTTFGINLYIIDITSLPQDSQALIGFVVGVLSVRLSIYLVENL